MARFTYRCTVCGHEVEQQHKIGEEHIGPCAACTVSGRNEHGHMRIKPSFVPTLYSSSSAFYKNQGIKDFPKAGPR